MFQLWRIGAAVVLTSGIIAHSFPSPSVEIAGVMDRLKDIYSIPDKLEELKDQYVQMQSVLIEQQRRLEEAQQAAEQFAKRQQELIEQNDVYREQNELLTKRIDQLAQDKFSQQQLFRKIAASVLVLAGMGLLYLISVRIWRYWSWRKHRNPSGGAGT
ncbi:hypothetical protein [Paenibacillus mendelii]|uniref:Uncharacterized protein n=1 Tax=Paenibacillus mendelii TaxID=206163 RepID=A0ABV6JJX1_9BACL|nr:hypothetical protein [Paenibacillus mendelii]MCQ6559143.1 hypothetical protein [Paenibacillus mendelii]